MKEKLKKIINESGNNLTIETVSILEKIGWGIELSSYYYDDITNKPREIDLIATKDIIIRDTFNESINDFKIFLFIECKNFKDELAFRVRENRKQDGKEAIIAEGIKTIDGWDKEFLEQEGLFRGHHYLQKEFIGKLYDSSKDDQNEIFNAITQSLKSLIFFKERRQESGIYYPVVVFSGIDGIYEIKNNDIGELDNLEKKEHSIFSLNYSYRSVVDGVLKTQQFYIDFLHKNKLESHITTILKEAEELQKYLFFTQKKKGQAIRNS